MAIRMTRGVFIQKTLEVVAAGMMTFIVTEHMDEYLEWVQRNPHTLPEYLPIEVLEDPEFAYGMVEAYTRIAMGEDPETMQP